MRASSLYLKLELLRREITQLEIADEAQVDRTLVSHVIAGRRRNADVEAVIARRLGVPVDTLFEPRRARVA
ncbi:MAG TPA: helix-turn-helix transcriptional regulator [Gemmatimonadaceae bacterium]|nr:helix-turn-helix transcriptional regulator [Gemmatimonadaceae bacterium]